jgi:hypothetical protein
MRSQRLAETGQRICQVRLNLNQQVIGDYIAAVNYLVTLLAQVRQ